MAASLPRSLTGAALALALLAPACAGTRATGQGRATAATIPTTTASTSTTSTTSASSSTTAKPAPAGLGSGSRGPAVLAVEQRLSALHYDTGAVDGVYDTATTYAVMAFQKVAGMARTGRATDDVVAAIQNAVDPPAMLAAGGATRVEIDLKRQVLFLYQAGALTKILPVSTGSGKRYCVDGQCDVAVTPGGSFRVGRKIKGLHISRLGQLWNPLFFNGGIAIHGAASVPPYPASHGCVRIPMNSTLWFFNAVASGTPVYVIGGPNAPVPFNEQAPPAPSAASTSSSTTTPPTTAAPAPSTSTSTSTTTSTTLPTTTTSTTSPPPTTP